MQNAYPCPSESQSDDFEGGLPRSGARRAFPGGSRRRRHAVNRACRLGEKDIVNIYNEIHQFIKAVFGAF